jgi:hypothetical protein
MQALVTPGADSAASPQTGEGSTPTLVSTPAAAQPASYLAPKRRRRAYGDKGIREGAAPLPVAAAGGRPTVNHAIQAMLNLHALDWASTQLRNCRTYLLSPSGRFQQWLAAEGLETIDQLTTERVAAFLAAIADRDGAGLKASTVTKYRTHLRSLARFQKDTPGYGDGLQDIGRIPKPRMPKEHFAPALTKDEEARIVEACTTARDRLIVELFLATGVRVSEMAGLRLEPWSRVNSLSAARSRWIRREDGRGWTSSCGTRTETSNSLRQRMARMRG